MRVRVAALSEPALSDLRFLNLRCLQRQGGPALVVVLYALASHLLRDAVALEAERVSQRKLVFSVSIDDPNEESAAAAADMLQECAGRLAKTERHIIRCDGLRRAS